MGFIDQYHHIHSNSVLNSHNTNNKEDEKSKGTREGSQTNAHLQRYLATEPTGSEIKRGRRFFPLSPWTNLLTTPTIRSLSLPILQISKQRQLSREAPIHPFNLKRTTGEQSRDSESCICLDTEEVVMDTAREGIH